MKFLTSLFFTLHSHYQSFKLLNFYRFLSFGAVLGLIVSCSDTSDKKEVNNLFLPNEASLIIKIKNFEKVEKLIENQTLLQQNTASQLYAFFSDLPAFTSLIYKDMEGFLAFSPLGKTDLGTTFSISATVANQLNFDQYYLNDHNYNDFLYKEYKINKTTLYGTQLGNSWIVTDSYLLMENHIKQFENSIRFKYPKALESLDNESVSAVIINKEFKDFLNRIAPNCSKIFIPSTPVEGWTAIDFKVKKSGFGFHGIYKSDSKTDFTNLFKNIDPQESNIAAVVPETADYLSTITYEDYSKLYENLTLKTTIKPNENTKKWVDFFVETTEMGVFKYAKKVFTVAKVLNESLDLNSYLSYELNAKEYRGIPIYKLEEQVDFHNFLPKELATETNTNFLFYNGFLVFAPNTEDLQKLIPHLKNNTTLAENPSYQELKETLPAESSFLTVVNTNILNETIKDALAISLQKKWKNLAFDNYKYVAFQINKEDIFSHLHLSTIEKAKAETNTVAVKETANIILKKTILNTPQLVTNYISKTKDIAIQDKEYNLHLYNYKGELKFSKNLKAPILGEIQQMDMYRNERLQYVFTTPDALYVLDRNGKEVAPFPIRTKSPITQPVALFDYDNNRKYRIVITHDSELTMYDARGKKVTGFKYINQGKITHPPKHIRVETKDYIVVNDTKVGVQFLDRTGKPRITPNKTPIKTYQDWFWYKNAFTTLNKENSITRVQTNNQVSYQKSKLKNAQISATTQTWVAVADNKLRIKDKITELEFGRYTAPKIFFVAKKMYITTTNLDNNKVYVTNSSSEILEGFPVFGRGEACIANIDKDSAVELVVKGDENAVLIYEF